VWTIPANSKLQKSSKDIKSRPEHPTNSELVQSEMLFMSLLEPAEWKGLTTEQSVKYINERSRWFQGLDHFYFPIT
jgi:hypothetical protein